MDNKKENNIFKKPWFWLVIAMMVLIIFLPVLSDMYAGLVPYKVNPKMINLNRLEFVHIVFKALKYVEGYERSE